MARNKYKKKKKEDDGKQGMDDNWVPGCVDLFILPLQINIVSYHFFTRI
ncbi:hypothetical protein [Metabacillus sediminilitoris]|nr:hypothetical protein [Metabacillus sediminilitoris]QGQ47680.1 hypothetical protein GMB29_21935 [Metabacillus sediminilitoris]